MVGAYGRVLEWEIGLPSAAELTPLSHPLIPPALAAAFRIDLAGALSLPSSVDSPTSNLSFRFDEDDEDDQGEEGEGETHDAAARGEGGRGGKKARMVWTPELHHRFVEAVAHLGEKGSVPKAIVRLMNVDGLTRENVASHLQKYRLYLKRTRPTAAATPPTPQPPPPLPVLYATRFAAERPPDTPNRSGYCAFVSSPARSSDATTKHRMLVVMASSLSFDGKSCHASCRPKIALPSEIQQPINLRRTPTGDSSYSTQMLAVGKLQSWRCFACASTLSTAVSDNFLIGNVVRSTAARAAAENDRICSRCGGVLRLAWRSTP